MQVIVRDCFLAAAGQLELIGKGSVLVLRQCEHCALQSPCSLKIMQARTQSHAAAHCMPDGPTGAFRSVVILLMENYASPHNSFVQ